MLLHAPVEEQAAKIPEAVAVSLGDRSLTYAQLDRQANLLACDLGDRGIGPECIVGVCAERSFELVIALLAVLKAGAAYLPLDPSYPRQRLVETIEHAGSTVVLADAAGRAAIGGSVGAQVIALERSAWLETKMPTGSPVAVHPDGLAYVIYTSGSTGRPKGVMCTHRGIVNRLEWMQERYRLTASDRVLQKTSIGFDVSVWELFWPLRVGSQLVLAKPGEQREPEALAARMRTGGVTVAHFVPSMLAGFISSGELGGVDALRAVICSGEALPPALRDRFFARSQAELHNLYGPTEASVDVTHHTCRRDEQGAGVPIGRAIEGVEVRVLDHRLLPAAPGTEGEICISGVGLARGYLKQPALTASAFVPDPTGDGSRLYRTGDRGRVLANGEIEFLGRRDGQVKIRGVRIELSEVEFALVAVPGVERAAVALAGDRDPPRLVGYFVGPVPPERLRQALGQRLPEQAVPAILERLESIPTLANGKTDRDALAALVPGAATSGVAQNRQETAEEATLARIWEEVLGVSDVSAGANFFSLGGDSIRSIEVVGRARAAGMRLATTDVFANPTLRDLARAGTPAAPADDASTPVLGMPLLADRDLHRLPADVAEAMPLTALVSGLVAESLDNPHYRLYTTTLEIEGAYERPALEMAIARVVERHPILRSAIDLEGFSQPLQLIYRNMTVGVEELDVGALSPGAWEDGFARWLQREQLTPFDWGRPPLLRFTVHRREEKRWQLTMTEPFLDGWSATVVLSELLSAYRKLIDDEPDGLPPPPRVSQRELVVAEREAAGSAEHRAFWREWLAGAPSTRLPRLAEAGGGLERRLVAPVPISEAVSNRLLALAKEREVPLKSLLLAAHARTIGALSGQTEVVCGLMVNGRPEQPDGERAVGLFLNTLPMRLRVEAGSWADLARAAHAAEARMLPWRRYPYARILHDDGGQRRFDSVFNFTHFRPYRDLGEESSPVRVRSVEGSDQTYFPLTAQFSLDPFGAGVRLLLEVNVDEFHPLQIEQLVDLHAGSLAEMARDLDSRHGRGALIGPRERAARAAWPVARRSLDRETRIETLFEERAEAAPSRIAVFDEVEGLSYQQVQAGAHELAERIRGSCDTAPRRVGVCVKRCPSVFEALLAPALLGAAIVPLDPGLPGPRLDAILRDAALDAVIADESGGLAISTAESVASAAGVIPIDPPHVRRRGGRATAPRDSARNPALVLYTSGSTGLPKGVISSHQAIVSRLRWMWGAYPFAPDEVCCVRGSLGFIDSITSLLGGVLAGVPTYVLPEEVREPDAVASALDDAGVTRLTIVPAILQMLLEGCSADGLGRLGGIKHWVLSGEPLAAGLVDRLRQVVAAGATILNLYGMTEVAGDATAHRCGERESSMVPAGRAIDATRIRVIDHWGRDAPCGAVGEVAIEGPGLATAYLDDPRMTADRFRPAAEGGGGREFRSGDLGRLRADGTLELCGRADRQVKVNGVRVEPAEVEGVLASHPSGAACGVVAPAAGLGASPHLIAFVELAESGTDSDPGILARGLRDFLRGRLPSPMVPGKIVIGTALPRTASGKIDHARLDAGAGDDDRSTGHERGRTPTERFIAGVWVEELDVDAVGPDDDFFELGGDSLTALRVLTRLSEEMEVELTLRDLFDHPTVTDIAARVELAS